MNKDIKKILLVVGLYALAGGLYGNFRELWMADNNLALKTIGLVLSLGSLLSVSIIFLCANYIKQDKLKSFTSYLLIIKSALLFLLFVLNHTGLNVLIKFLIMVDYVVDVQIYASIYPLMTLVNKDNKIFATKGLIYMSLYYIGVLLTSILLGRNILRINFSYNIYCLLGSIVLFSAFLCLKKIKLEKYYNKEETKDDSSDIVYELIAKLRKDTISQKYLLFIFTGGISYYCITGLALTVLTNFFGYSSSESSNMLVLMGISSVIIGAVVLTKMTLKNNYFNISIKFVGRIISYVIAVLLMSKGAYLFALIFTKITSDAYTHVTDAPYINRFDTKYQLAFSNAAEMSKCLSRSIGIYLCGVLLAYGIHYIFLISIITVGVQTYFAFSALKLLNVEQEGAK